MLQLDEPLQYRKTPLYCADMVQADAMKSGVMVWDSMV